MREIGRDLHIHTYSHRVQWLKLGDGNNSVFHNQAKAYWNKNKIIYVKNNEGILMHGKENLVAIAIDFFLIFFGLCPN